MDAVWDGRSDGSRDEAGSPKLSLGIGPWEGVIFGVNVWPPNVTNGDGACSKITLGNLVLRVLEPFLVSCFQARDTVAINDPTAHACMCNVIR